MNQIERNEKLVLFARAGEELAAAVLAFPRAMWKYKPGPKRWSIHEIILHLADSEAGGYVRCRRAAVEPGETVAPMDADKWVEVLDYQSQDADEALALFKLMRGANSRFLKARPAAYWLNTVTYPSRGTVTMDDWLTMYALHVKAHIEQMKETHAAFLTSQEGRAPDPDRFLFQQPKLS